MIYICSCNGIPGSICHRSCMFLLSQLLLQRFTESEPDWLRLLASSGNRYKICLYTSDRQTMNELTGGHTMVRELNSSVEGELEWLRELLRGTFVHFHYFPFACHDSLPRFPQMVPLSVFL